MTIKTSGPISMDDINNEFGLGRNLNSYRGVQWFRDDNSQGTFGTSSISMNEFYSKRSTSPVVPGSANYTTAGTFTFTVPVHNTLIVELWGGGAGGSGTTRSQVFSSAAGASTWDGGVLVANGGSGSATGTGGTASGGDTNTTGGTGESRPNGSATGGGAGGAGANGGAGGARQNSTGNGFPGTQPGGAGGGGSVAYREGRYGGSGGGGGAYCQKTYSAGTYTAGSSVTVVVGAGSNGGLSGSNLGGAGAAGRAIITWS